MSDYVIGARRIAAEIFDPDARAHICLLGDSITFRAGSGMLRWLGNEVGIRGFGHGVSGLGFVYQLSEPGLGETGPAVPYYSGYVDTPNATNKHTWNGAAGTIDPAYDAIILTMRLGSVAVTLRDATDIDAYTVTQFSELIGYDWWAAALAVGPVTIKVPFLRHPGGQTTPAFRLQVRKSGTPVIDLSASVSAYAATTYWDWMEVEIPQGTSIAAGDYIGMDIRLAGGSVMEAGKSFIYSGRAVIESELPGLMLSNWGCGGSTIRGFSQESSLGQLGIDLLDHSGVTHVIHSLGVNAVSGRATAELFAEDVADLVDRMPASMKHIFAPTHYGINPAFGGQVGESYFTAGYAAYAAANPNTLFLNRPRKFPAGVALGRFLPDDVHQIDDANPFMDCTLAGLLSQAAEQHANAADIVEQIQDAVVAAVAGIDTSAIAAGVYQRIIGSSLAMSRMPVPGDSIDAVLTADLSIDSIEVTPTDGSQLIFTLKKCLTDTVPIIEVKSDVGLTIPADPTGREADGTLEYDSPSASVWVRARSLATLSPCEYYAELREIVDPDQTISLWSSSVTFRRVAGAEMA